MSATQTKGGIYAVKLSANTNHSNRPRLLLFCYQEELSSFMTTEEIKGFNL